jgi:hypothetical protein
LANFVEDMRAHARRTPLALPRRPLALPRRPLALPRRPLLQRSLDCCGRPAAWAARCCSAAEHRAPVGGSAGSARGSAGVLLSRNLWHAAAPRRWQSSTGQQPGDRDGQQAAEEREHELALPTILPEAAPGCSLHLALQLLHVGTAQPERVTVVSSLPPDAPLAEHVEQLVLEDAGETTAADGGSREERWRERLYELWQLPSSELQEMLALRGLDYELDGDDALDDEWVEIDEWEPSDLPDVVERHEDEAATDPPQASAQADSGFGHAILAYRMLEYEQELAAFGDEDGAYDDDSMFGPADSEGASGTWQLSTGGGADAAAMAEYEALVGVVRGHLPVPEEIQGAVGLLQVRA